MTPATRLLFPVTAILSVLFASPVFAQNAGAPVVAFNTPAEGEVFASGSDVTVNGGQILGDVPPAAFNHEFDSGRGSWTPYPANFSRSVRRSAWSLVRPQ